jgi:hypothetical protein
MSQPAISIAVRIRCQKRKWRFFFLPVFNEMKMDPMLQQCLSGGQQAQNLLDSESAPPRIRHPETSKQIRDQLSYSFLHLNTSY